MRPRPRCTGPAHCRPRLKKGNTAGSVPSCTHSQAYGMSYAPSSIKHRLPGTCVPKRGRLRTRLHISLDDEKDVAAFGHARAFCITPGARKTVNAHPLALLALQDLNSRCLHSPRHNQQCPWTLCNRPPQSVHLSAYKSTERRRRYSRGCLPTPAAPRHQSVTVPGAQVPLLQGCPL